MTTCRDDERSHDTCTTSTSTDTDCLIPLQHQSMDYPCHEIMVHSFSDDPWDTHTPRISISISSTTSRTSRNRLIPILSGICLLLSPLSPISLQCSLCSAFSYEQSYPSTRPRIRRQDLHWGSTTTSTTTLTKDTHKYEYHRGLRPQLTKCLSSNHPETNQNNQDSNNHPPKNSSTEHRSSKKKRRKRFSSKPRQQRPSSLNNKNSHSHNDNDSSAAADYSLWESTELTITDFNMDLHNIAMEDAQRAQDALEIMEELYRKEPDNPMYVQPTAASYTIVIEGWCYGTHPDGAKRAQHLLDYMETECSVSSSASISNNSGKGRELCPNELTYLLVCQKWAENYKYDFSGANINRAEKILNTIKKNPNMEPSGKLYSIILDGWCRRVGKVRNAMQKAESILAEMEEVGGDCRPNVLMYTSVIGGLARSKEKDLATRADQMIPRMEAHGAEPDMVLFTSILNCWSKAVSRKERSKAAERAQAIIREMEDMYIHQEKYHVKPNGITYATAIKAIGNSLDPRAPKLAEEMLRRMYSMTKSRQLHVPPTVASWNAVITSLSTSGSRNQKLSNAKRAEHLLVEMIRRSRDGEATIDPNVRTWGSVLRAWAESGQPDCGEQAQRVLDMLEDWSAKGETTVRPNCVCYTTVISAWGRGNAPSEVALEKVESLLQTMEDKFAQTQDTDLRPNKITYVTAIDAFCRKSKADAGQKAQATVDRMMRLYSKGVGYDRPTRIVFNALINAWSRSDDPNGASNAEEIFQWMETQYRAGDDYVRPDQVTLCAVLNAWANNARDGGALRAQQILDHTESLSDEERGFSNSIFCYNIVIKAWGRSRAPDAVRRAEKILLGLEKGYQANKKSIRPDITTYSSVINCCAYYTGDDEEGKREALQVALRTFQKIKRSGEGANHIVYGTLFKAIAKMTQWNAERTTLVRDYFNLCCSSGQVETFVLNQVRSASPPKLYRELVLSPCSIEEYETSSHDIIKKIPKEWTRNVQDI